MDREAQIDELWSRQRITDILFSYCRACDRLDEELMESLFWPDATAYHGPYRGSAESFWRGALSFLGRIPAALHYASNVIIRIDGDFAQQEALFTAWHRVAKGPIPGGELLAESAFAQHDLDQDEDAVFCGRYVNWFERRGDEWRIIRHICFTEWEYWMPASERSPVSSKSLAKRDRSDPVYWLPEPDSPLAAKRRTAA
jgi:hypothetical protein